MAADAASGQITPERRIELDWLRTLIVLGAIPFHAAAVIGVEHTVFIVSATASPLLTLLAGFVVNWGIPLIFMMSGAAARYALETRSPGAFLWDRVARLGVPLVLVVLVFSPVQIYYILLSNPSIIGLAAQYGITMAIPDPEKLRDFPYFYQQYIHILTSIRGYAPAIGGFVLGHLWFVPRLIVISFICLPIMLYLRGRGRKITERITTVVARPVALLLAGGLTLSVLVALAQGEWLSRLTAGWIFTDDWPAFFIDLAMFLGGFLIYSSERLRAAVRDIAFLALALGVVCAGIVSALVAFGPVPTPGYPLSAVMLLVAQAFSAWLLPLALLGIAMRYLTHGSARQRYLTAAAFPVFVLHGPLLTASAYYLLLIPMPPLVRFLLVLIVTLAGSFATYEYVVRRTRVTRLLFGAKAAQTDDAAH